MKQGSASTDAGGTGLFAGDAWFDPIEAGIQELLEQEPTAAPSVGSQSLLRRRIARAMGAANPSGQRAS